MIITSTRNAKIKELRKLEQKKHRYRQQRFKVEGLQLIFMALEVGIYPEQVFYCQKMLTDEIAHNLLQSLIAQDVEIIEVSSHVIETLSDRDAPQGIVATYAFLEQELAGVNVSEQDLVLVLDQLQDPGNLGTLIRTADSVGAGAVVIIEPCVDLFHPKAVRGSMGSIFNLPIVNTSDAAQVFQWLTDKGIRAVGTDPHAGINFGEGLWDDGAAIVLGNEARGMSDEVRSYLSHFAKLPMVGDAESLNVATAGTVFMYQWLKSHPNKWR